MIIMKTMTITLNNDSNKHPGCWSGRLQRDCGRRPDQVSSMQTTYPTPGFLLPGYSSSSCVFRCFLPPGKFLKSGLGMNFWVPKVWLPEELGDVLRRPDRLRRRGAEPDPGEMIMIIITILILLLLLIIITLGAGWWTPRSLYVYLAKVRSLPHETSFPSTKCCIDCTQMGMNPSRQSH